MNYMALIGILLVIYGVAVIGLTLKKPASIWDMKKIKLFIKLLGNKGTDVFFFVFAAICIIGGVLLIIR